MIHTLLSLSCPLIVLDTETTGTDPKNDRIVELGFQVWTAEGMTKEYRTLINPGIRIPTSATKVHGITDEKVNACQTCGLLITSHFVELDPSKLPDLIVENPPIIDHPFKRSPFFREIASNLVRGFLNCDYAGKRVRFDLEIIAAEMRRAEVEWSYVNARIIDIDRLEQIAIPRGLSDLYKKYTGNELEDAHGALADVKASLTVIVHQLTNHAVLPRDVEELHRLQWADWLDVEGKFKMVDGVPTCRFGKHKGKRMQDVPLDYYDFIIRNDFPEDVKQLARDAKMGKFPGDV